jgi:hypothetical protein
VSTESFTPLDAENLPWKELRVRVQFSDGTTAIGHFSPEVEHRVFWELCGTHVINGRTLPQYRRHLTLPIGWQPFPATKE